MFSSTPANCGHNFVGALSYKAQMERMVSLTCLLLQSSTTTLSGHTAAITRSTCNEKPPLNKSLDALENEFRFHNAEHEESLPFTKFCVLIFSTSTQSDPHVAELQARNWTWAISGRGMVHSCHDTGQGPNLVLINQVWLWDCACRLWRSTQENGPKLSHLQLTDEDVENFVEGIVHRRELCVYNKPFPVDILRILRIS